MRPFGLAVTTNTPSNPFLSSRSPFFIASWLCVLTAKARHPTWPLILLSRTSRRGPWHPLWSPHQVAGCSHVATPQNNRPEVSAAGSQTRLAILTRRTSPCPLLVGLSLHRLMLPTLWPMQVGSRSLPAPRTSLEQLDKAFEQVDIERPRPPPIRWNKIWTPLGKCLERAQAATLALITPRYHLECRSPTALVGRRTLSCPSPLSMWMWIRT